MRGHTSRRHSATRQSNSLMRKQSPGRLSLTVFEIFTLIRFSFNNAAVGLHQRYMFFPSKVRPFANSYLHRNLNGGFIVSHVSVNFIELFNQFILPRFTANGKEGNRIFCSSCLVFNNLSVLYCTRPLKLNVCQKSPSIINTILVYSAALYMPACVRVYNRPAFLIVISACPISLNQH